jgi:hypothetical protein
VLGKEPPLHTTAETSRSSKRGFAKNTSKRNFGASITIWMPLAADRRPLRSRPRYQRYRRIFASDSRAASHSMPFIDSPTLPPRHVSLDHLAMSHLSTAGSQNRSRYVSPLLIFSSGLLFLGDRTIGQMGELNQRPPRCDQIPCPWPISNLIFHPDFVS